MTFPSLERIKRGTKIASFISWRYLQRLRRGAGGKGAPAANHEDQDYQLGGGLGGSIERTHSGRGFGSNPDLIPPHNCK